MSQVVELKNKLQKNGSAIVLGASGSGKTENIDVALGNSKVVFDLRNDFLEDYFEKEDIAPENRREIGSSYYTLEMKEKELEFISAKQDRIIQNLIENPEKIVVFDEFDLASTKELTSTEVRTCNLALEIAKRVSEEGKKVVLVMHESGMNNQEVRENLNRFGFMQEGASPVVTGYLDKVSQKKILGFYGLNKRHTNSLIELTQGTGIYLSFLKLAAKGDIENFRPPSIIDLLDEGYSRISSNWYWAKQLQPENIQNLLIELANDEKSIDHPDVIENKQTLLLSGLIGEVNEELTMPPIVKHAILSDIESPTVNQVVSSLRELNSEQDVETYLPRDGHPVINNGARLALRLGGSYLGELSGVKIVVPKNRYAVNEFWKLRKNDIANALDLSNLTDESGSFEHLQWRNTATSVEELVLHSNDAKNEFLNMVSSIVGNGNEIRLHTGENHQYLIKSEKSIQQKIAKYSAFGTSDRGVLQKINDPLRATVIVRNVEELQKAIDRFSAFIDKDEGIKAVCSNKWSAEYPNGYVGIHFNLLMKIKEGGETFFVRSELQFHLEDVLDGTDFSPDHFNHLLYEMGRIETTPEENVIREGAMKLNYSAAIGNVSIPEQGPHARQILKA